MANKPCTHPPARQYAWIVYDPQREGDYLCMGCCACGAVVCGAVDSQGDPVGPQKRMGKVKRQPLRI